MERNFLFALERQRRMWRFRPENINEIDVIRLPDLNRVENLSSVSEGEIIQNHLDNFAIITRRNPNRRIINNASDDESPDINRIYEEDEGIFDFRTYPLNINWFAVENDHKDYFTIFGKYGYFGVAVYSALEKIKGVKIDIDNFFYGILNYFTVNLKEGDNDQKILIFIFSLPSAKKIKELLEKKMFFYKEVPVYLMILKLIEIFYLKFGCPCYRDLLIDVIPAEILLGKMVDDEIWEKSYNVLTEKTVIKKLFKELDCQIFNKRKSYINHLDKMRKKYEMISKGVDKDKFIV